jgi:beta-glucosidase
MYLGGEAVNAACVDLLLGRANPCGKLPETWPLSLDDTPCAAFFPGHGRRAEYRESVYTGYRWYSTAQRKPAFPFGFGLSYTSFNLSIGVCKEVEKEGTIPQALTVTVSNTGSRAGSETAQVYVSFKNRTDGTPSPVYRPTIQLAGWEKVFLEADETREVSIKLDERAFSYWNTAAHCWAREAGVYTLLVGTSSADFAGQVDAVLDGDNKEAALAGLCEKAPSYYKLPATGSFAPPLAEWEAIYGQPEPANLPTEKGRFTKNSTLTDIRKTFLGRYFANSAVREGEKTTTGDTKAMMEAMLADLPLRMQALFSGGRLSLDALDGYIALFNGHFIRGLRKLFARP